MASRHLVALGTFLFEGPPHFGDGIGTARSMHASGTPRVEVGSAQAGLPYFFANRSTWLAFSISSRAASAVLLMPAMRSLNSSGLVELPKASSSVISPWRVEVVKRLVKGLHSVLGDAGRNGVMNQAGLIRIDNAIADIFRGNQHFHRRGASNAVRLAHQALGDDRLQGARQLQANLLLFRGRENRDDTLNGFRGVHGVQSGEHHVAGLRGQQRRLDGFQVAHFAHQNDVRVLAEGGAQGAAETRRIHFHFALVDRSPSCRGAGIRWGLQW